MSGPHHPAGRQRGHRRILVPERPHARAAAGFARVLTPVIVAFEWTGDKAPVEGSYEGMKDDVPPRASAATGKDCDTEPTTP